MGAGESQIVGPDGAVLARGPREGEAVVTADIDLSKADDKLRPDGTHLFRARRPELYAPIAEAPSGAELEAAAASLEAAVYQPARDGEAALDEVAAALARAAGDGVELCVLPELFCFEGGLVRDVVEAAERSARAAARLAAACAGAGLEVVTSLVERDGAAYRHVGVLVDAGGVRARQPQLHASARHPWATPGGELGTFRRGHGRLALLVGDDALFPETAKLAALAGAHLLAAPFDAAEPWETELGLPSRAAENRVCVVAATRPRPCGASLLCSLERDFTLLTPWEHRTFDGNINLPITTRAARAPGLTRARLSPDCARNKVMSSKTHLLDGRPFRLAGELARR
jgi:predicted amidohydrolase